MMQIKKHIKQLIRTTTILAVVLVFLFILYSQLMFLDFKRRLEPIAEELLYAQSSSKFFFVGGETASRLSEIASRQGVSWKICRGDPFASWDNKADACIIYMREDRKILGLRMDCRGDEIHILGYWTPTEN